jgi:hypothetical protein
VRWAFIIAPVLAMGPFEKNHPLVGDGEAAYERGDYEGALEKFNEADRELPNNANIAFDRGVALHKLGRNDEARQALLKASELNQGKQPLESKIRYNLGNVWAATGNKKEAISEYRKALRKDPNDEEARHNLEVLLKDLPPPQQNQPDGGSPDGGHSDGGHPDAGQDGGQNRDAGPPRDGGSGDAGVGDGGSDGGTDGGRGADGGSGDGGSGDGGQGQAQGQGDGGADGGDTQDGGESGEAQEPEQTDGGSTSMSRKEAERMLDSVKNSERNLQMWRFKPDDKERDKKRRPHEKDW